MGFFVSRAQLLGAAEQIRLRFESSVTPLVGVKIHNGEGRARQHYFGTATYFTYLGFPFVLTAQHVLEKSKEFSTFVHGTATGERPFPLRSCWVGSSNVKADIAIWGCFQTALDDAGITPLPYKELLVSSYAQDNALYVCNGFPDRLKTELPFMGETTFAGNPFIGQQTELPDGAGFDDSIHFAIKYPCDVPPPGMSGSPVWNMRLHCMTCLEAWSHEAVTFAGVVHRWDESTKKLIATRVEYIRDFIPGAVNHLRSKYNWKTGDD